MKNTQQVYLLIIGLGIGLAAYGSTLINKTDSLNTNSSSKQKISNSSDCNGYYPVEKGTTMELTSYNKKGKEEAVVEHTIIASKQIDNGVEIKSKMVFSDKKGNPENEMTYESKCQNGKYYLNLENLFSQLITPYESQGMEIIIEDGFAIIPNNLSVGDKLEDASLTIKMNAGIMNMVMTVNVTDRVILAKESLTTTAGTFDCLILSQTTTTTMGKLVSATSSSKSWISKGVGSVKYENYNKSGKLDSYTLLTKFRK
jgi:hypothetical protein